ncbi:unannotated protein [freshwater metagenome]|uniref:Unannotated protein n=1 Tax=freshwater metagenome TaxID=449393 RepID=A0A6J7DMH8_9ZZZZ
MYGASLTIPDACWSSRVDRTAATWSSVASGCMNTTNWTLLLHCSSTWSNAFWMKNDTPARRSETAAVSTDAAVRVQFL